MKYIRFTLFMTLMLCCLYVTGQTQQGVVKTRGRMVNGQLQSGLRLNGATIKLGDRSVISKEEKGKNGIFSFPVRENRYVVKSVIKNGYQLVDMEACRSYTYSREPLYIVMETPEQQKQDLLESERKIRRTLQQQLQKREDELDALKEEHKITIEEYQEALQQLYATQKNTEKFISDMAKEYARMDYDQMTELNRRIHDAISNGRLVEADSLINSKGNIYRRIAKLNHHHDANVRVRKDLEKSEMLEHRSRMEIAEDCYSKFEVFIQANCVDSALCYLKMRADLDSTNILWAWDYAQLCDGQRKYAESRIYYERALSLTENMAEKNSKDYLRRLIGIKNSLAGVYKESNYIEESEKTYLELLNFLKDLAGKTTDNFDSEISMVKGNLAILYNDTRRFDKADSLENEVMRYEIKQINESGVVTGSIFVTLWNRAITLEKRNKFEDAKEWLKEIIYLHEEYTKDSVLMCKFFYVDALKELANVFAATNYIDECESLYLYALSFCLDCINRCDDVIAYIPDIFNNLGILYAKTERYLDAEEAFKMALKYYKNRAEMNPVFFEPYVVNVLSNLAKLYGSLQRIDECQKTYTDALIICRHLAQEDPDTYYIGVCNLLREEADFFLKYQHYDDCIQKSKEALECCRYLYQKDSIKWYKDYAEMLGNLSYYLLLKKSFAESEKYAREGLTVDSTQHFIYSNLAPALLLQGKTAEAEKIYDQFKNELKESFLEDFDTFAKADVIPKECEADVERIKKLLNE